ncbi:MAG: Lrp/AsnC ligand binding domain-containing protein [Chloroflexota bacterium]
MKSSRAFVLVEVEIGKIKEVLGVLRKADELKTIDAVTGPYDLIAVIEASDLNAITTLVTNTIGVIPGVTRTITCFAITLTP